MYNQTGLGLEVDFRPYPGRHRKPESAVPVMPPPWALAETGLYRLPGESTVQLSPLVHSEPTTVLRPPMHAPGAALEAVSVPVMKPEVKKLARCLRALRFWGRP